MYSVSLGAAGGAQKAGRRHFGGGETIIQNISRQGEEYERAAASCCVGVMMRYAHYPFIRGCESMRLGDNILLDNICAQSDASPPPAAPPAAPPFPPGRLFWGMKA